MDTLCGSMCESWTPSSVEPGHSWLTVAACTFASMEWRDESSAKFSWQTDPIVVRLLNLYVREQGLSLLYVRGVSGPDSCRIIFGSLYQYLYNTNE